MEEIQEQELVQEPSEDSLDNSSIKNEEGQATNDAPSSELILGKFKSVEDLTKAYQELEKYQGIQSQELGELRQNAAAVNAIKGIWEKQDNLVKASKELEKVAAKYNTPQYFQDPSFREMYKQAYLALGKNLDADKFINLLEGYVSSRIFAHDKMKSANSETQRVVNSMTFEKNNTNSLEPPKKRLDEMTPKEVDELLERLI